VHIVTIYKKNHNEKYIRVQSRIGHLKEILEGSKMSIKIYIYIKISIISAMGFKVYIGLKYATPKKIQIQILNSK
jgi:hypothetical protein